MKFLIRADASLHIGSGHIMRCLTLAQALREQGHSVRFITRAHVGHLADWVQQQGFECVLLPEIAPQQLSGSLKHAQWLGTTQEQDFANCQPHILDFSPDWIVCDHYALDKTWQQAAKKICAAKIAVIDDLHDRIHQTDVLIDQNFGHTAQDYADLLPEQARVLAGTRYALLRQEFAAWRASRLAQRNTFSGSLNRVFINLGGVDKDNFTLSILKSLEKWDSGSLNVTVAMGATAPHIRSVQDFAENAPFDCQVIVQANNMAELMAQADWAVGAAGSTSWERCCLGLPTLLLVLADNQRTIAEQLHHIGAAVAFHADEIGTPAWFAALAKFRQPEYLAHMAHQAQSLCDGKGAARVVRHIQEISQHQEFANVRRATLADCRRVFDWRNHADIRRFMFDNNELIWEQHQAWFHKQLDNPDFQMLIYVVNQTPQGYVSFKKVQSNQNVWEWGFYTAPDCPRGHGSRMGRLALDWAFAALGAREIQAAVLADNSASLKMHEKLGFFRLPEQDGIVSFALSAQQFLC